MNLSPYMQQALQILTRGEATCSNLGAELTQRKTSFGPQTSAREGGRTLRALERRKLVRWRFDGYHWQWSLTPLGREALGEAAEKLK